MSTPYIQMIEQIMRWPWSGRVDQGFNALANLLSPHFAFNFAGNADIEKDVVANIASYGNQLGLISKVLLEISEGHSSEKLAELTEMVDKIDKAKADHKHKTKRAAIEAMERLRNHDPDAFAKLLSDNANS